MKAPSRPSTCQIAQNPKSRIRRHRSNVWRLGAHTARQHACQRHRPPRCRGRADLGPCPRARFRDRLQRYRLPRASYVERFPPKVIWLDVGTAGTVAIAELLRRERIESSDSTPTEKRPRCSGLRRSRGSPAGAHDEPRKVRSESVESSRRSGRTVHLSRLAQSFLNRSACSGPMASVMRRSRISMYAASEQSPTVYRDIVIPERGPR